MKIGKKIVESNVFKTVVAFVAALFIKLVRRTSSFEIHRYDILQRYWAAGEPIICATWHGQNTLLPTFWHNWRELRVLVSLHGDGEIIARCHSLYVWVDLKSLRPIRIPEIFLNTFLNNISTEHWNGYKAQGIGDPT